MENCIFCKIANGEIPSYKVYEDDKALAFLDIAPVSPGHTLIIPKKHFQNMESIPDDELIHSIKVVKKIGQVIKKKLNAPGYNISVNNDPIAGQIVPHLHFHVIPRKEGDGLKLWPQEKIDPKKAMEILNILYG
jgi:histidine triad (HIT) family protein